MKSSPVKTIILFFIALILVGTALLCLPFARHDNAVFSFISCLFTATSAVCVTGLSVVDIGTYFNMFGQIIILALVQIGGLGYMLVSTGIGLILGKMALKDRQILRIGQDKSQSQYFTEGDTEPKEETERGQRPATPPVYVARPASPFAYKKPLLQKP